MKAPVGYLRDDSLLILLFHGVIPKQSHPVRNYTSKHITRDAFIKILRELEDADGAALSMAEILAHRRQGKPWPRRAYAVTFDDGFANNFTVAAPVLDEMNIPATFYVTTRFIEDGACSWIDQIEYAVERSENCELDLPSLGVRGRYPTPESKKGLLAQIRSRVKSDARIEPYDMARQVWTQLAVERMEPDGDLDRKMTWTQVRQLEDQPRFTVGGHGHTHRILSYLSGVELERELDESFRLLKAHLRKPIEHYSYPEGLKSCYSPAVIAALKARGVQCCPSAEEGVNDGRTDLFELRRVMVD